jgi:hypothetical protein
MRTAIRFYMLFILRRLSYIFSCSSLSFVHSLANSSVVLLLLARQITSGSNNGARKIEKERESDRTDCRHDKYRNSALKSATAAACGNESINLAEIHFGVFPQEETRHDRRASA